MRTHRLTCSKRAMPGADDESQRASAAAAAAAEGRRWRDAAESRRVAAMLAAEAAADWMAPAAGGAKSASFIHFGFRFQICFQHDLRMGRMLLFGLF